MNPVVYIFLFHLFISYTFAGITSVNKNGNLFNERKHLNESAKVIEELELPNDNDVAFLDIHDKLSDLSNFSDYISMSEFMNNQKLTDNDVVDDFYLYEGVNLRETRDTAGSNNTKLESKSNIDTNYNVTNVEIKSNSGNKNEKLDDDISNRTKYSTLGNNSTVVKSPSFVKEYQINKMKSDLNLNLLKKTQTKTKPEYGEDISSTSNNHYINVPIHNDGNGSFFAIGNNYTIKEKTLESKSRVLDNSSQTSGLSAIKKDGSFSVWTVTLILAACIVVVTALIGIGVLSTVAYRRYYWNKPQAFSDKCSNADSTGYIDDSTMKENSEEMYSLDNDSFLNSLEAMTIQNYWADNIKHTKL